MGDARQAIQFNLELEQFYVGEGHRLNFEHLIIPEDLRDEDRYELDTYQLTDLAYMVTRLEHPERSEAQEEEIFQFHVKMNKAQLSTRLFGEEISQYLKYGPKEFLSRVDCLALFLLKPAQFNYLTFIQDSFEQVAVMSRSDEEHGLYQQKWHTCLTKFHLLVPAINAGNLQQTEALTRGLRWLIEFGLLNDERCSLMQKFPLGMQLLAQVAPEKGLSSQQKQQLAFIIFKSLSSLFQAEEVKQFFQKQDMYIKPYEPPVPPRPRSERHQLASGDKIEVVSICEYDVERSREIRIRDAKTKEIKHILPEDKRHAHCVKFVRQGRFLVMESEYNPHLVQYEGHFDCAVYGYLGGPTYHNKLKIWDLNTNTCIHTIPGICTITGQSFLKYKLAANYIAYYDGETETVCRWNMALRGIDERREIDWSQVKDFDEELEKMFAAIIPVGQLASAQGLFSQLKNKLVMRLEPEEQAEPKSIFSCQIL